MVHNPSTTEIQVGTLAKKVSMKPAELRKKLRDAGVKNIKGTKSLNHNDKINIAEAHAALGIVVGGKKPSATPATPATPAIPPADPINLARLASDASSAATGAIPPAPVAPGPFATEDDPIPPAVEAGETSSFAGPPQPSHPDDDKVYYWIPKDPNYQSSMHRLGWRPVTRADTMARIRPDGLFRRMIGINGCVTHNGDVELWQISKAIYSRYKQEQQEGARDRASEATGIVDSAVEDAQRTLRDRAGRGADRHVQKLDMTEQEVTDRRRHATARARGESGKPMVFVGQ